MRGNPHSPDPWERFVALERDGVYESNYLKANSPDGARGLWIKHNLLRPLSGPALGEFWAVLFARGEAPVVAKREVPLESLELDPEVLRLRAGPIMLLADRATGEISDLRWDLRLTGGLAPVRHLRGPLYRTGFPKKKILTPRPNLRFDGWVEAAGIRWDVERWTGLRGHNWGTEHAHTYAYGNCNLWDDGTAGAARTVDGFSARVKLGARLSPWLSSLVVRDPDLERNHLLHWLARTEVSHERWSVRWPRRLGPSVALTLTAPRDSYVGLRYAHPGGAESYCYNTKFADVRLEVGREAWTSRCGELEVLFPEPLDGVALHPSPDWTQGDYRSD